MHVKVPSEARRQHWILLELELQAVTNHTTWLLGTKPVLSKSGKSSP